MRPVIQPQHASVAALVIFVVTLAGAPESRADQIFGVWKGNRAPFWINPGFGLKESGEIDEPIVAELSGPPERQIDAILCASDAWNAQTRADFRFEYQGTTEKRSFMRDDLNTVSWVNADGGCALAATCLYLEGEGEDVSVAEFDVVFYGTTKGVTNRWSTQNDVKLGQWDIIGIAVHELGHGLGLNHVDDPRATMFFMSRSPALGLRTLNETDQTCVEMVYGTRAEEFPSVQILSVDPLSGSTLGGNELVLSGVNFTWSADTRVSVGGRSIPARLWDVDLCDTLRISAMPSHDPALVGIEIANSIGVALIDYEFEGASLEFVRSDANADGRFDVSDALALLGFLFRGDPEGLECEKAGDFNGNSELELVDAVSFLQWRFRDGGEPVAPFPDCGTDLSLNDLGCDLFLCE